MDSKSLTCVNCGFSEHIEDAEFCQNCGISLRNFCKNNDCEANSVPDVEYSSLPWNAKYCPYCGEETSYYEYLSKLDDNKDNN